MKGFLPFASSASSSRSMYIENLNCLLINKASILPGKIPYLDKMGIGTLIRQTLTVFSNIYHSSRMWTRNINFNIHDGQNLYRAFLYAYSRKNDGIEELRKLTTFSLLAEMRQKGLLVSSKQQSKIEKKLKSQLDKREIGNANENRNANGKYVENHDKETDKNIEKAIIDNPQDDIEFTRAKILRIQSCKVETRSTGKENMEIFQITTMIQRKNVKEPDYVIFEKSDRNLEWKICGKIKNI